MHWWCDGMHAHVKCSISGVSQAKDYMVLAISLLSTQNSEVKAKTGWLGIRIMCQSV